MGTQTALSPQEQDYILDDENDGKFFIRASVITTPDKLKVANCEEKEPKDETPIKHSVSLKRRSLMRDMDWEEKTEESVRKHTMEMRSRKCRKMKKEYYDYKEYSDYGEDLSFLFDEQELQPRRKPRKKRQASTKKSDGPQYFDDTTSTIDKNANCNPTSAENFSKIRPNPKKAKCNDKSQTSHDKSAGTNQILSKTSDLQNRKRKNSNPMSHTLSPKILRKQDSQRDVKKSTKLTKTLKISLERTDSDDGLFLSGKSTDTPTVRRMSLRRRHSTPSLGGADFNNNGIPRTVSTPAPRKSEIVTGERPPKFEASWAYEPYSSDISDSEQFVDSPDSGFSSETSCSAVTPDTESAAPFTPTKSDDLKSRISRTSSNDSGIQLSPAEDAKQACDRRDSGELRLNLCQESILEAQRLEREAKEKQEEEKLREKYQCQWEGCPNPFESLCGADLHTHLEKYHAENYCCKWRGCKFFDISSRKLSFLQRHIGEHSGEKPYKCILDGCDATFSSTSSWKRHVEAHYSEVTLPKARVGGDNGVFPRYLLNSRRVEDKRKTLANRHDCMDERTLSFIRSALIQNQVAMETDDGDLSGPSEITLHSEIIGERSGSRKKKTVLVKWKPEHILPNEWVSDSKLKTEKTLKVAELPRNAKETMNSLFFFGRRTGEKSSRKSSILDSIF